MECSLIFCNLKVHGVWHPYKMLPCLKHQKRQCALHIINSLNLLKFEIDERKHILRIEDKIRKTISDGLKVWNLQRHKEIRKIKWGSEDRKKKTQWNLNPLLVCAENRRERKIQQKTGRRIWFSTAWMCEENTAERKIGRKGSVGPTWKFSALKCAENAKKTEESGFGHFIYIY